MPKLTLKQGEAKLITLTITTDGTPLNLSGADLRFVIKKDISASTTDLEITEFNTDDAVNGIISFYLSEELSDLSPGQYYGELIVGLSGEHDYVLKTPSYIIFSVDRSLA